MKEFREVLKGEGERSLLGNVKQEEELILSLIPADKYIHFHGQRGINASNTAVPTVDSSFYLLTRLYRSTGLRASRIICDVMFFPCEFLGRRPAEKYSRQDLDTCLQFKRSRLKCEGHFTKQFAKGLPPINAGKAKLFKHACTSGCMRARRVALHTSTSLSTAARVIINCPTSQKAVPSPRRLVYVRPCLPDTTTTMRTTLATSSSTEDVEETVTTMRLKVNASIVAGSDSSAGCALPPVSGRCLAYMPRYYFDPETKSCARFIYGGCLGNCNKFISSTLADICLLPADVGPCRAAKPRYYYDTEAKACVKFRYGGCYGNCNNFATVEKCEMACPTKIKSFR
uniref:BPTI/Kunitz inhibitor domain-containing protein n=1 Tax=Timema bartmani TaxID=61472 RepID=A0A7R9F0X4_9NEOP|nr:unnamed protein product [Timema bartmani]